MLVAKYVLYTLVVICFTIAGIIDLAQGHVKPAILAVLLALINGLIFLWRI